MSVLITCAKYAYYEELLSTGDTKIAGAPSMVLGEMEWTHHTNAYSKEVERRSRLDVHHINRISWSIFPVQIRFFPIPV